MTQYLVGLRHDPTMWQNLKVAEEKDNAGTVQFKGDEQQGTAYAIVIASGVTGTDFGFVRFTPNWPENSKGEPPEHLIVHQSNILWIVESEKNRGPIGFAVAGT